MERTEFLMPRTKQALLDWKAHLEKVRKKKGIRKPKSFKTQVRSLFGTSRQIPQKKQLETVF
jgi:hypothetical protein